VKCLDINLEGFLPSLRVNCFYWGWKFFTPFYIFGRRGPNSHTTRRYKFIIMGNHLWGL